ncbi:hypothetical protein CPT03_04685 [Pedobacter ginsengisoli]|uniref:Lipid/polyisoprenoid-binding YceI-like domain-containing protein n=1 Tax=Pedobacter ginsengisoli TaxID=363852 RepID=A0A2D1U2K6_9SPHI|nr:hypothetical protein [Pedobacter ginsengisoli]ATP55813.1 hypothetical protein CPT03_04685 [Pedobacter ginsengisoli]
MRTTALLLVFVLLSAITKAQKPVPFKFKYLPIHTYGITKKIGMSMKAHVQDLSINTNKKSDTTVTLELTTELSATVKTKAISAGSFPVTLFGDNYSVKTTFNGVEAPAPEANPFSGLAVNGKIDSKGELLLDTVGAENAIKYAMNQLISGMAERLEFPDKPMKIGDTFTQQANLNAMNIPDLGIDSDYPTSVTYKLIAVKDNLAYFDIISEFKMIIDKEVQGKTVKIDGKGTGTGKMEFFVNKGYPKSIVNNVGYVLDVEASTMKAAVKFNMNTDANYAVNSGD